MATPKKKEAELTQEDPEFLPVQYDMRKAQISKLKKQYDPVLIPEANEKGDEGYLVVHNKVMDITKVRTAIEAKRKDLKSDALAWGKLVDGEAKRLTEIVAELEKPWRDLKVSLDEKEAKEAEAAREREAKRIAIIEGKVEQLKNGADGLLGLPVSRLKERLRLISDVVIDETYDDYMEAAQYHKDIAIGTIDSTIAERETFEEQQAQLKANQEALAAAQKEIDDKAAKVQKELDDKAAELDRIRQENEQAAADKMAEQQKKMDEQQASLDKQKAEQEEAEAAEKQRKEDEAFAELEEKQRKEKEAADAEAKKVRDAELYKRLPEDVKMRDYADRLLAVEVPTVESEEMDQLNVDTALTLGHLAANIYSKTQG